MDISSNRLEGNLADEGLPTESIALLDLSYNFFTGPLPLIIANMSNLTTLRLSDNEFTGSISTGIENLNKLEVFDLGNNQVEGSIPKSISYLGDLQYMMLQNNRLTGTVPKEVGGLTKLLMLSLSYNKLKGTIPSQIRNLKKLSMLHLHRNKLVGGPDEKENCGIWTSERSFIADCGEPSAVEDQLQCECCTECCNIDGHCQKNEMAKYSPVDIVLMVMLMLCAIIFFLTVIFYCGADIQLPDVLEDARELCGADSAYSFFLAKRKLAWFWGFVSVVIQILLFLLFLKASSFKQDFNDWQYSMRCPAEMMGCNDEKHISTSGWVMFYVFMALNLLPDTLSGIRLIYLAVKKSSIRCLVSGLCLLSVTIFAVATSSFYNNAIAQTDTEVLANAVILLFINEVDELLFELLTYTSSGWIDLVTLEGDRHSMEINGTTEDRNTTFSELKIISHEDPVVEALQRKVNALESLVEQLCKNQQISSEKMHDIV